VPKRIAIIGSTGSIGRQTLEVIRAFPRLFKVAALSCNENIDLLERQINEFKPVMVAVCNKSAAAVLKKRLTKKRDLKTKIFAGTESFKKIAGYHGTQKIVFASSGITALNALILAIKKRKQIALANKEMIVAAGGLIMNLARKCGVTIVPIDSEHSAIFQCLQGEDAADIEKIILTCSGGPFFGRTKEQLKKVTAADAVKHPAWNMGEKISVDSATLMNKGFEIIEAMHLFGLKESQIEVVIHQQCVVHSLVQFKDGSVKAQLAPPDMRLPITYALAWPQRIKAPWPRLDLKKIKELSFYPVDNAVFKGPALASAALKQGGNMPAALALANDKAVREFLGNKIGFHEIYPFIERELKKPRI